MRDLPFVLIAAVFLAGGPLAAAEKGKDAQALVKTQRQFRSRTTNDRVDAARRLAQLQPVEAATLAVTFGFGDKAPEVRSVTYKSLLTFRDDRECTAYLLKSLPKTLPGKSDLNVPSLVIGVLVASELPGTQADLDQVLEKYMSQAANASRVVSALTEAADNLGRQGDSAALPPLKRFLSLKACTTSFACRRAAIQAIISIRVPEAIDLLIERLPTSEGEVRADILYHLAAITEQAQTGDAKAWQEWWTANRKGFQFPAAGERKGRPMLMPGTPSYYGLSLAAKRMVFTIDISGSMHGEPLAAAKRELVYAVEGLSADVQFSIVAYNSQIFVWQRHLVPAQPAQKQSARDFVSRLMAGGRTITYDALETAFQFDAEAIYLLTDGMPTAGKFIRTDEIVRSITQMNRQRRLSVYAIGIGPRVRGPFDTFLEQLSQENYGLYRKVAQ